MSIKRLPVYQKGNMLSDNILISPSGWEFINIYLAFHIQHYYYITHNLLRTLDLHYFCNNKFIHIVNFTTLN